MIFFLCPQTEGAIAPSGGGGRGTGVSRVKTYDSIHVSTNNSGNGLHEEGT